MKNGRKNFDAVIFAGGAHGGGTARLVYGTEPNTTKTPSLPIEARHSSGKTGRVVVDYNGAKVPWAPKAWVHTPEGTLRGADIVWDTYPSLDVQQRPPESDSQYESQIDRYS